MRRRGNLLRLFFRLRANLFVHANRFVVVLHLEVYFPFQLKRHNQFGIAAQRLVCVLERFVVLFHRGVDRAAEEEEQGAVILFDQLRKALDRVFRSIDRGQETRAIDLNKDVVLLTLHRLVERGERFVVASQFRKDTRFDFLKLRKLGA